MISGTIMAGFIIHYGFIMVSDSPVRCSNQQDFVCIKELSFH